MRKAEALRLGAGSVILFADARQMAKASHFWTGRVVMVTPRGGLLVRVIEGKTVGGSQDWRGPGTGPNAGVEMWIPYSHVVSVNRKVRRSQDRRKTSQDRRIVLMRSIDQPRQRRRSLLGTIWEKAATRRSPIESENVASQILMRKSRLILEALLW